MNQIIASLVLGASIIVATAMWIYFSPYQTCLRSYRASGLSQMGPTACLKK